LFAAAISHGFARVLAGVTETSRTAGRSAGSSATDPVAGAADAAAACAARGRRRALRPAVFADQEMLRKSEIRVEVSELAMESA
jgi:hypothetical protein